MPDDRPSKYVKPEGLTEMMGEDASNSFSPKKKKSRKLDQIAKMNQARALEVNQR